MTTTIRGDHTGVWGVYEAAGDLPNASGAAEQSITLRKGHLAIANITGAPSVYICTSSTLGAATWAEILSAGQTVVGNITVTGDVTVSGTVQAEQLTTTDDATVTDDLAVTGLATVGETLAVTGATTLTGGVVATQPTRISNIPIGAVARASIGTDAVHVAGSIYFAEIFLPANKTLTGIGVLNGSVVGTDNLIVGLYSSTGTLLRSSALAGALSAGADGFQEIPFTSTYAAVGPARYWLAVQCEGTTAATQRIATATYLNSTGSQVGVFGTMAAITPTATTTADVGPIGYVY
jgi:hypothetical protein